MRESQHTEFESAYANEKKVTYKSGLFGKKEVVTGERFVWEYLDEAAASKIDFDYSGFLFIDYFFTYVVLPDDIQTRLNSGCRGEHYYLIDSSLASAIRGYLTAHRPSIESLTEYSIGEGKIDREYPDALLSVHDQIVDWMGSCTNGTFLVLHLTF